MDRLKRLSIILMASIALSGCAEKQEVKEPTPITIEKKDITDTAEFKQAVSQRVDEVLGGEVSLTVYLDTAEDFNYIGEMEIINDGSDGTRPVIFIHADPLPPKSIPRFISIRSFGCSSNRNTYCFVLVSSANLR